jgi:hypothetical protein
VHVKAVGHVRSSRLREMDSVQSSANSSFGGSVKGNSADIAHVDVGRSRNMLNNAIDHVAGLELNVSTDSSASQYHTYLTVGGVRLDSILLSAVHAITQAEMAAMLVQGNLLLSNTLFLVLDLLDVGVSGTSLQLENLLR